MKFYLDTSVFGGVFDDEFKEDTATFLKYVEESRAEILYSDITDKELEGAPENVRDFIKELKATSPIDIIRINIDERAEILARHYIKEGALAKKCEDDARHIALASIHGGINALVSWNFRHMVNFIRIQQYNGINLKNGYTTIDIRSPKEIIP